MPPRVNTTPVTAVAASLDTSCHITRSTAAASRWQCLAPASRSFTTTTPREKMTKARFEMYRWLEQADRNFNQSRGPRYLGPFENQVFPNNPQFRSQPVLSEETRQLIYSKVVGRGEALKAVSEEMQIDVRRVAAVVRLVQVEKDTQEKTKLLARPYARAVMSMLPQTRFEEGSTDNVPHEPINDIPVHNLTMQQLFVPVSESRHFTREDAAKAFHDRMLSADARSPQRELIEAERDILEHGDREEAIAAFRDDAQRLEERHADRLAAEQAKEKKKSTWVSTDRYTFRFKEISAEDVGRDGRSRKGVGWRYGAPLQDRKRGMVKIPTSVP